MKQKILIDMPPVKIGKALTAQWRFGDKGVQCEWDPEVPRAMTRQMKRRYLNAQRSFMIELATAMKGSVVMYGLDGPEVIYPKICNSSDSK